MSRGASHGKIGPGNRGGHWTDRVMVCAVFVLVSTASTRFAARAQTERDTIRILDPMRVTTEQPPDSAVLALAPPLEPEPASCDVLVVGASTGGVAAALAAAEAHHSVCLTEETSWIGGQMTAQGVSALDENPYVETAGGTASYRQLRDSIRRQYRRRYRLSNAGSRQRHFNPGNCWVSGLCFEPRVALDALNSMLRPSVANGFLRVFLRAKAVAVERNGNRITSVLTYGFESRRWIAFHAAFVLDATDTGELLPLLGGEAGVDYVTGAEPRSLTREPHAPEGAGDPLDIQSLTYTFLLAREPDHDHRLAEPPDYAVHRRAQSYRLGIDYGGGKTLTYHVFDKAAGTPGSFWVYRRLVAADNFQGPAPPRELSMVNWPGNDYCGPDLLAGDPGRQAQALREAKLASLGFAYWLQTEAPRDDAGSGYPELEFQTGQLGSADGLSQFPYIRESRRIKALETIREQDIAAQYQKGPRAARFSDSAGIGDYPVDIHNCSKQDLSLPTKPFQIPLGAMIPFQIENLLAASKDIGTTHITNGAYRVHPVEWAIGEAAGALAAFALDHNVTPARIQSDPMLTEQFQSALLERGAPVYWFDDLEPGGLVFQAAQLLAARGILEPSRGSLHFGPKHPLTRAEAVRAVAQALDLMPVKPPGVPVPAVAVQTRIALQSLTDAGYLPPTFAGENPMAGALTWPDLSPVCEKTGVECPLDQGTFHPATRAAFAVWLWEVRRRKAGAMR